MIIVGGSYAGLSAAITLGRSIRTTLILDSGNPCNRQTPRSHGFMTQDGATPLEIREKALKEVLSYPTVEFKECLVTGLEEKDSVFLVTTESGERFTGMKVLMATGIKDTMLDIPGFSECWGISVLHCPYCHGYEVRQQKTALLASGERAYKFVLELSNWTQDIVMLTDGPHELDEAQLELLQSHGIEVIEDKVLDFDQEDGRLKGVRFKSGEMIPVKVMYTRIPFTHHSDIASEIGCELSESGHIIADEKQKTNVPGIFAAGDCSSNGRAVSIAVSAGTVAGMMINSELIFEQVGE